MIFDEFYCAGFNTNSVLELFGRIKKGRPNTEDLKHDETFAQFLQLSSIMEYDLHSDYIILQEISISSILVDRKDEKKGEEHNNKFS